MVGNLEKTFSDLDTRPLRIFTQDEAIFGRISRVVRCWAPAGVRPIVPHQIIRQYLYTYSALCPATGENFSLILPRTDFAAMQLFLDDFSEKFNDYRVIMIADQASWHKSQELLIPSNIRMLYLPPRSPELNPTEHLWEHLRENYFHNREYPSLEAVEDALVEGLNNLTHESVKSFAGFKWIVSLSR
jgi:transposase